MKLVILKTNIETKQKAIILKSLFYNCPQITNWSVDTEDIDKVLRIEAATHADQDKIIQLVKDQGFQCEELKD